MQTDKDQGSFIGFFRHAGGFGGALRQALPITSHDDLAQSAVDWFRTGLITLSVVAIGYIWSQLTWLWLYGVSIDVSESTSRTTLERTSRSASPVDYAVLTRQDPFFAQPVQTVSRQSEPDLAAPETNLDLKLFGIRAGDDVALSSAIIRTPDKEQRSFRVGEAVMEGVQLHSVLPDRIVLSRSGILESLFLDPDHTNPNRISGGTALQGTPSTLATASSFLAQLPLEPRVVGGRIDGFYIRAPDNPSPLTAAGLEAGDLVTAINGVRLISAERIADVIEELETATNAELKIQRDGQPRSLTLNFAGAGP